jgi:Family of unknown function (DUF5631)/Family of unknown function (DUF5632)
VAANSGNPWFHVMVGQWWTPEADLGTLTVAANKRHMASTAWQHFSDELRQQLTGSLSPDIQKGMTADNLRDAFTWGADQAGGVAKTNGVISESHGAAHRCASELNSRLKTIADEGKSEIEQIQQSKDLPPVKLGKIVEVVMRCQQDANSAAAPSTQNVFEAMQNILDQRGIHVSARQFAQQHGIDTTRMLGSPNKETITDQVKGLLGEGGPPQAPPPGDSRTFGSRTEEPAPLLTSSTADPPRTFGPESQGQEPLAAPAGFGPQSFGAQSQGPLPANPATTGLSGVPGAGGSIGQPAMNAPLPTNTLSTTAPANAFGQSALSGAQPPNPFMQGFDHGLNQGAPTSAALNNVSPVTGPVQPQVPVQPPVSDVPASTVPATAPAVDAPQTSAPPAISSHSAVTDSGTTYLAGPAAAASSAPAAPIGSLPTYGSDIRPPMPTISAPTLPSSPAATPSFSSAASPASAPVSPSAGAGGLAQPVVRQPTAAPLAHPAPASIGEQAVVATAGGAAAGAASAQATAKARLQRLVDFVAHQEPRLRWTAGEQADGTTVLVTDLASGWIPPGIALPSVVTLLDPGERRGDIEALVGQVSASASYTPLHYLPESTDGVEPIPTSPRPRQVPAVDELGWELGQATNWRDGLPQMAHTLAKAASTGTGVVDNEVEFLQQHLATLRDRVLDVYPDDVDGAAVANWQLLASIEALAASDLISANYHFAWFQALNYVP